MLRHVSLGIILLISMAFSFVDLKVVTEVGYHKLVNGNSGLQFLAKTSINLDDNIVLKLGVSETYTGPRSSPTSFNHNMLRMDVGVCWILALDFQACYWHSQRNLIAGATNTDVFNFNSVDIISIRKVFDLNF